VLDLIIKNPQFKIPTWASYWFHPLLLLLWIAIGTGLRFTNLASKPPSTIELATLVFSLGNSLQTVPLDRAIALDTLLQPLQPHPEAGIRAVIDHLMTESTHPPVYFVLAHLWMKLFPTVGGLVSLWGERSLSAVLGVASIPAIFGFGCFAFRSRLVGQMAAAMMAVSPYGIFLAQEARHYTLTILLLIASLCCLVVAVRTIHSRTRLPIWVGLIWVGANSLGIAVHYFFVLGLCAEALVLLGFWIRDLKFNRQTFHFHWWRIYAVAAGTLVGGLVWIPALQDVSDNELTQWIYSGNIFSDWLEPIARLLAWIITMLALLPVEGVALPIAIASGLVVVMFILWALPIFISSLRIQMGQPISALTLQTLGGFTIAAIALFFCITYGLGADLTLAARYHFVYFPSVIVLLGSSLAICWDASTVITGTGEAWSERQQSMLNFLKSRGKKAVMLILVMGFLGGLTVVSNVAYQKSKRPDILVPKIQEMSQVPVLIATLHKTHHETRAMMGLAFEFKRASLGALTPTATASITSNPQFLLAHKGDDSRTVTDALYRAITQLPRPLDLWTVNFTATIEPEAQKCVIDSRSLPKVAGYKYRLYHCL
jgi:uncharacterized membrane protein